MTTQFADADCAVANDWTLSTSGQALMWENSSSSIASTAQPQVMPTGSVVSFLEYLKRGGPEARLMLLMQISSPAMASPSVRPAPVVAHRTVNAAAAASTALATTQVAPAPELVAATTTLCADQQLASILEHLSLRMSDIAEMLGVTRTTAYSYLNGEVLHPKDERTGLRLRGLYQLSQDWAHLAGEPMGRMWSLPLDERVPSLRDQLMAEEWDTTTLQHTLATLASMHRDRAERRRGLQERGFGRGRNSDADDRDLRRIDDAVRGLR